MRIRWWYLRTRMVYDLEVYVVCYLLRVASVYKSGGSISFADGVGAGWITIRWWFHTQHSWYLFSIDYTYIYLLVSRLRRHDARKPLYSKYTLVIGGCGEECEAVCLAPTFISSGRFDCLVSLTWERFECVRLLAPTDHNLLCCHRGHHSRIALPNATVAIE